ncbi:MAG: DUF262 domain-containing protein [Synergistaceae bacterium]|nr:DUF262 domain-containing protein [Synergistaceae bacterium]
MILAQWESITVREAISRIHNEIMVLPVIQRNLVWEADKMELLFDSLFRKNSFGSIICVEEARDSIPLFAHRIFMKDGSQAQSVEYERVRQSTLLIIDGQQRLQSFYSGLCGTYEGKTLYFDLFSNPTQSDYNYNFRFASSESALFRNNKDSKFGTYLWYSASDLFSRLQQTEDPRNVARDIANEKEITNIEQERCIEDNVSDFYTRIFADSSIGLSKVIAHMSKDVDEDRQRIAEMFQRLNTGGTRLSSYELVASSLKSFNYKMESFLVDVIRENKSIGIDQDILIKMLLVLNDKPTKSITDISSMHEAAEDAEFATNNMERIRATLTALKNFLKASGNEEWFSSVVSRSAIPLHFIAYHIFWQSDNPNQIRRLFDQFDTQDKNFRDISSWLRLSLLNNVFKRGCGWDPMRTGMNKIHEIMYMNRGRSFPLKALLSLYKSKLHAFFDKDSITPQSLDSLDQEYIFYMIYGGRRSTIRIEDKDHIHPQALLKRRNVSLLKINNIGNLQYLDYGTNRGEKSCLELRDWINLKVPNKEEYLSRHLIPEDKSLWTSDKFIRFLNERLRLIEKRIKSQL